MTASIVTGSICNGVGGSIIWVAQGKYLANCVKKCEERSGLYTSLFWTICLGSQVFAYLFNSIILGYFTPLALFTIASCITLIGLVIFGMLPDPEMPDGYLEEKEDPKKSFEILISLLKDKQCQTIFGLFFNSACAAATAQGLMVPFYCLILKHESLQE